jgi:hypothetical protein
MSSSPLALSTSSAPAAPVFGSMTPGSCLCPALSGSGSARPGISSATSVSWRAARGVSRRQHLHAQLDFIPFWRSSKSGALRHARRQRRHHVRRRAP